MFKHQVRINKDQYHELAEMSRWCSLNIGPGGYLNHKTNVWYMETMFGNSVFYFKNGHDATAFALKWSYHEF